MFGKHTQMLKLEIFTRDSDSAVNLAGRCEFKYYQVIQVLPTNIHPLFFSVLIFATGCSYLQYH